MLNEILAYAERSGLKSEPGFTVKTAKWVVSINEQAEINAFIALGDGQNGKSFNFSPDLSQGEMIAGGVVRSQFLIESLAVVALFYKVDADENDQKKFQTKHQYFIRQLELASEHYLELAYVAQALKSTEQLEKLQKLIENCQPKPKSTDSVTFLIGNQYPLNSNTWHEWWRKQRLPGKVSAEKSKSRLNMRCLLTGAAIEPVETHPKIKGLSSVGGLGTGDVFMAFDKEAFQSYGLEKSANAATDEVTAKSYVETFNNLIADQSIRLVNGLAVYWFGQPLENPEDDMFAELESPSEPLAGEETRPKKLLNAIHTGEYPDLLDNHYYVLTVSGQAGRVMVRDWQQGRLTELLENVCAWFDDLQIVARDGRKLIPSPKFLAIVGSLVRDLKDAPAPLINELWRTALNRKKTIPYAALINALMESRKAVINEEPQNHARMGLIKAYHIRKGDKDMCIHINPEHPKPEYQCGRLLAVLAELQYAALGDVGAGVVQRYYTATSQAPALRIGQLMSNAKNHLNKINRGLAVVYENRLSEIMCRMTNIPKTLDLEQQSLFALGYYHQLAQNQADIAENKAKKIAKQNAQLGEEE
jgi:CRISPR-associated protein Csd1